MIDERVNIYEKYDDSSLNTFIDKAKEIFEKYKENCNPDNKNLYYEPDDNTCYNISSDEHAHGGYGCTSEGKWDKTKCIPFYCDIGYYFDKVKNKCILDKCTETEKESGGDQISGDPPTDNGGLRLWVIIVIIFGSLLIIVIIIVVIIKIRVKKTQQKEELIEEGGELMEDK